MEPKSPAQCSSNLDFHPSPMEFHEITTELCEEGVTYAELKVDRSSNIQRNKITRTLKTKESPCCLAAMIFAFLYVIAVVIAAVMIAKVNYLKEILKEICEQNETTHC
ncbi:uncharacterized protein LOC132226033 [Myotis daubentonii]|uniref:uncharacterized protein LOC132226033 n=1 Tax=Myotis daubentonii TaxID=98922 RepID=UPI0028738F91|nr:uncharacterized protein LOC132226033 [Myotis daubentonii]